MFGQIKKNIKSATLPFSRMFEKLLNCLVSKAFWNGLTRTLLTGGFELKASLFLSKTNFPAGDMLSKNVASQTYHRQGQRVKGHGRGRATLRFKKNKHFSPPYNN